VIMCYIAYKSGERKKKTTLEYFICRYSYFVLAGLFINFVYYFYIGNMTLTHVIWASARLSAEIYDTFWCMKDFLFASSIAFFLGYTESKYCNCILAELILILMGQIWVPICLLGIFVALVLERENKNSIVRIKVRNTIMTVLSIALIKICAGTENKNVFFMNGVSSVLILIVLLSSDIIKRNKRLLFSSVCGRYTMGIFLIHPICYEVFGSGILAFFKRSFGFKTSFFMAWLLCLILIVFCAYLVEIIVNNLYIIFMACFEKVVFWMNNRKGKI